MRAFVIQDIDRILEIEEQAFPKTPYSKDILLGYANRASNQFVVLEVGEDIVGYIIYGRDGHVISTAVLPGHRRMGFGRMLFRYALKDIEKRLWLEVRAKNESAIGFYETMGMTTIGRTPNYYGDDDALILASSEELEER